MDTISSSNDKDSKEQDDKMEKNEHIGYMLAIIGGIGLGLLLGSEFSGKVITGIGAILTAISLLLTLILSMKKKKII